MNSFYYYWDRFLTIIVWNLNQFAKALKKLFTANPQQSTKEQIIFMKRLSMMLGAGMPIVPALELLAQETKSPTKKLFILSLVSDVSGGQTLSNALRKFEQTIGSFSINIIRVGELSGTLPENLAYLTTELKQKADLRKQIIGTLIYPAIIIIATLAITIFLIVYIFPKILPIFISLQITLPLSTRILMFLSQFLNQFGLWVLFGLIVLIIIYLGLSRTEQFLSIRDKSMLKLPIFGRLIQYYNISNCCRTLGLLLKNETRITEALAIVAESTANRVYRLALNDIKTNITTGKTLATQLQVKPQLFPSEVANLIQAGESSGNLSGTLIYLANMYNEDIRDWTKNLTTVLEPVLMLIMGLAVGFIAISIITPIYGITQNLHP